MSNKERVLGYSVARELTQEEVEKVSGGASGNYASWSGPGAATHQDDVTRDAF
jgi:hypothetical protein